MNFDRISVYALPGIVNVKKYSVENLSNIICDYFQMPKSVFNKKKLKDEQCYVRDWAIWFSLKYFYKQYTVEQIGKLFNKHRTTVIHSREKVRKGIFIDKKVKFLNDYESLSKILNPIFNVHNIKTPEAGRNALSEFSQKYGTSIRQSVNS